MLNASLTGAVPLWPQSSSPCFSVHVLARKQAGKKEERKDWTEQNRVQKQQFQAEGVLDFPKVTKAFQESILLIATFAKKVVNKVYFMQALDYFTVEWYFKQCIFQRECLLT